MLTRSTQIGEFYVMQPPQVYPGDGKCQFTSDLLLYDEKSDRHVRIEWKDAVDACCINAADAGTVGTIPGNTPLVNPPTGVAALASTWKLEASKVTDMNTGEAPGSAAIAANAVLNGTPIPPAAAVTSANYSAIGNTGGLACRIVIARPFIEHLMHSVIICVAGRDTGATLFGPADMQLSANTQVKTIEGHYTYASKICSTRARARARSERESRIATSCACACRSAVATSSRSSPSRRTCW